MRSFIVISLIIGFMTIGYFFNKWFQKRIMPNESLVRLVLYFLIVLISVFVVSLLMVLVIGKLYPNELMK
jgi:fructose-specific phosphotransferase system IIC component